MSHKRLAEKSEMEFCILLRRPLSFDDYYLGCFLYVALTSWRSETSNISVVVLDKKKSLKGKSIAEIVWSKCPEIQVANDRKL